LRIRVKICGITRPVWARAAAEAGADFIGLVFAESPRQVTLEQAAAVVRALPRQVAAVGVFVDEPPQAVLGVAEHVGLEMVQLHGDEPPEILADLEGLKVIKVFRVGSEADVLAAGEWRQAAERLGAEPYAYLVDARVEGGPKGGTGRPADWTIAARLALEGFDPLILSGGLGPENVAEAVRRVQPWGVDGSTALESAPGQKDPAKIRAFIEAARGARA